MWEKMSIKMFALLYKYLSNKQTFAFVNLPLMKILQFSLFSNLLKVGLSVNWDIAAGSELIIVHKNPISILTKQSGASGLKCFVTFAELLEYSSLLEVFKHH